MSDKYTKDDKTCPHCTGRIAGNLCGDRVIYWCTCCGSNNPNTPPNVKVDLKAIKVN